MDYSGISFDTSWSESRDEMETKRGNAIIYGILFAFTGVNLLISIIRTISTNPGNIPDHKEWDMSTDTSGGEESVAMMSAAGGP